MITNVTAKTLDVKQTKDGKTISMATDEATLVTRDKKKFSATELKAGLSVVIDASGDSLDDTRRAGDPDRSFGDKEIVAWSSQESSTSAWS